MTADVCSPTSERCLRRRAERVAVLGDLHIAAPGRPLAFDGALDTVVALVERLRRTHELVVINGDLYDLERGPLPFDFAGELARARQATQTLTRALTQPNVLLTGGNHDEVLVQRGEAARSIEVVSGARREATVRVEHGHRFDAWVKRWRPFTSLVTWVSGRAMLGGARGVYSAMRRVERRLTGEGRRSAADGCNPLHDRALRWLGREDSCEVLVMGHTHCAGLWTREGRLLANPGGCTAERLGYVTLDLRLGRATVYAIEKEREFGLVSASRNHDGWWTLDEQHDR